jgi:DNA-binding PadR family transcriptional regulator
MHPLRPRLAGDWPYCWSMPAPAQPRLSLAEWLVLCLVCEAPTHGFAITRVLGEDGDLGQIWRVPKPVIYRALQRLEVLELVATVEVQPSTAGPARSLIDATKAGRRAAVAWLNRPVSHNRDIRSELLVKLALLERAGADTGPLLAAQRDKLEPVSEALRTRLADATGLDRTVTLWRCETVAATLRFLEAVREPATAARAR